jgi:hypothetical protein
MMRETIWEQFEHAQEWQRHYNFSFKRVRLVDGTSTRSPYLMKRKAPDETWQIPQDDQAGILSGHLRIVTPAPAIVSRRNDEFGICYFSGSGRSRPGPVSLGNHGCRA